MRLEIVKGALDSLTRFSFGAAMLCAGDRVRHARGEVTNWNPHADELSVSLGRKQSQNPQASGGRSCPRLEQGSGERRLLLRAFQDEPHAAERCDRIWLLCPGRRHEKKEHAGRCTDNDSHQRGPMKWSRLSGNVVIGSVTIRIRLPSGS